MVAHDIIIKPILSEKSYADIANKKYYFKVRAYKKTDSGTLFGSFSTVRSAKIK